MKTVNFTSTDGGQSHRELILSQLAKTRTQARSANLPIDVQIMAFAFTDKDIAQAICSLTTECKNVQVRIIADWSQGAPKSPSVVTALADSDCGRIAVKLKIDLPYFADPKSGHVRWGYHTSHGMLHHKTMLVSHAGKAKNLLLGSFNWGNRGTQAYENTMHIPRDPATAPVLDAFQSEFDAMWYDPSVTVEPAAAGALAIAARQKVQAGGSMHDLEDLQEVLGHRAADQETRNNSRITQGSVLPAFSGRHLTSRQPHYGFAKDNNRRSLNLLRPSGKRKPAPVSINSVALEAIRGVQDGDPIKVAMYAMSPRVPEFGALIDAARRGCAVQIILDAKIGRAMGQDLAVKAHAEKLPITVKASNRRMHQKYILAPASETIVTGTANMTLDSASRHAEHRILFRNDPALCDRFQADFDTIWGRLGA